MEERAVYEREKKNLEQEREKLARERQSVFEHVRSLEGYKELNKDMLVRAVSLHCAVHLQDNGRTLMYHPVPILSVLNASPADGRVCFGEHRR